MKLRIEHDVFADAVNWTAHTIPPRPALPILAGMKLQATSDGAVTLGAYDPEMSSTASIEAAVDEPEEILVNGHLLASFVSALPNKPVDLTTNGPKLELTCGTSRMSMQSMELADYPDQPELGGVSGIVDGAEWKQAVSQVVTAASRDDTLPLLVSVCMEIEGEHISLMATDRYRLAVVDLTWKPEQPDFKARVLVHAGRLADISKGLGSVGDVRMTIDSGGRTGLIGFEAAGRTSVARLIDGDYPQVRGLFPKESTGYAVMNRHDVLDALKRASLVVERNSAVRLSLEDESLVLTAGHDENAQTSEALQAHLTGEPITMAFNPDFLKTGFGALTSDYVRLSFTHPTKPAIITGQSEEEGEDSQAFRLLLMPIRTYA